MKRIVIIEREYGCGAAEIAEQLAHRLNWRLLDRQLTDELAKLTKLNPEHCARKEERLDPWLYRLGKTFWRGSYERTLPLEGTGIVDADRMLELVKQVVIAAAEAGQCVIVGRGAPYILRNRPDTFTVFLYAPRAFKIARVQAYLNNLTEAERLVETVDRERADFVKHYFGKTWPHRQLYHLMVNTVAGIDTTVELLLHTMEAIGSNERTRVDID